MVPWGCALENFNLRAVLTLETHHSMRPISMEDLHWFGQEINKQRGKDQWCINCCMWSNPLHMCFHRLQELRWFGQKIGKQRGKGRWYINRCMWSNLLYICFH
mmetsp:Transcript_82944/g.160285  ORF Transcript_82944/g.160285 Transcript_82944/m.160285 type:complete len:103 (-) Transcript_82944:912-1220(-)